MPTAVFSTYDKQASLDIARITMDSAKLLTGNSKIMEWIPIVLITLKIGVLGTGMFFAIKWHYDRERKTKTKGEVLRAIGKLSALFVLLLLVLVFVTFIAARMLNLELTLQSYTGPMNVRYSDRGSQPRMTASGSTAEQQQSDCAIPIANREVVGFRSTAVVVG